MFSAAFIRAPIILIMSEIPHINAYLRFILTFSSHVHLGLPRGLFPVDLPVKILKALLLSPF